MFRCVYSFLSICIPMFSDVLSLIHYYINSIGCIMSRKLSVQQMFNWHADRLKKLETDIKIQQDLHANLEQKLAGQGGEQDKLNYVKLQSDIEFAKAKYVELESSVAKLSSVVDELRGKLDANDRRFEELEGKFKSFTEEEKAKAKAETETIKLSVSDKKSKKKSKTVNYDAEGEGDDSN